MAAIVNFRSDMTIVIIKGRRKSWVLNGTLQRTNDLLVVVEEAYPRVSSIGPLSESDSSLDEDEWNFILETGISRK